MNKIKKVSFLFRVLFQIAFIALPLLQILAWMSAPDAWSMAGINMVPTDGYVILYPLGLGTKMLGFGVSLIPLGVGLFILYSLIKLFRLYEEGNIFSIQNVKYIRNIGYLLLIGQVLHPLYQALLSLVLTWHNPVHERYVTVSLNGVNVGILLTGLLVVLISWIMAEGHKMRDEQQLTI